MCLWPSGYGVSLRHMKLLVRIHYSAIYFLLFFFVTGNSQRTLYICYPIHHMLANIQRSLTVTGNKRINQIMFSSQLDLNQQPHVPQAAAKNVLPFYPFQ